MPRMAAFFYAQALEERGHAMMMVQYLLDTDHDVAIPAVEAPVSSFEDVVAPVALALDQERRVTEQVNGLLRTAREEGDFASEQFMQWFIKGAGRGGRDDVRPPGRGDPQPGRHRGRRGSTSPASSALPGRTRRRRVRLASDVSPAAARSPSSSGRRPRGVSRCTAPRGA